MSASRFDDDIQPLQTGQRLREAVNPARLNAIATLAKDGASGANMRAGPGLFITRGPQGTIIKMKRQIQRGSSVSSPLDCYIAARADGSLKVQVRPGTVLGVMPEIAGTRLDVGTPPYLVLSDSETKYVVVKIESTFLITGGIYVNPGLTEVTVTIELDNEDPGGAGLTSTDGSYSFVLATYVSGVKTLQNGYGPIGGEICDNLAGTHTANLTLIYPGT